MTLKQEYLYKEFKKDGHATSMQMLASPPIRPVINQLDLGANDTIVELSSADGGLALSIARLLKNRQGIGEVIACDFSRPRIEGIAQEAETVGVSDHLDIFCLSDIPARTLPFDNATVDAVLSMNMVQYLSDPVPYLAEISRVLAPCGTLLAADWDSPRSLKERNAKRRGIGPEQLHQMLNAVGLDANSRVALDGYNWAFRAVKPVLFSI